MKETPQAGVAGETAYPTNASTALAVVAQAVPPACLDLFSPPYRPPSSPAFIAYIAALATNLLLHDSEQKLYVVPLCVA